MKLKKLFSELYNKWTLFLISIIIGAASHVYTDTTDQLIAIYTEPERSIHVDSIQCSRLDNLDTIKVNTDDLRHYFNDMKMHVSICIRESEYRQNQKLFQIQENIQEHIKDVSIINPYAISQNTDTIKPVNNLTIK